MFLNNLLLSILYAHDSGKGVSDVFHDISGPSAIHPLTNSARTLLTYLSMVLGRSAMNFVV